MLQARPIMKKYSRGALKNRYKRLLYSKGGGGSEWAKCIKCMCTYVPKHFKPA